MLRSVDLEVRAGEFMGLIGPNGSGKTTLLRAVSGVLRPGLGTVVLHGRDITCLSPRDRAKLVAVVQQSPAVPLAFTALEVVLMGRNPHLGLLQWEGAADFDACRRAMDLTDTAGFSDRYMSSLSGGEQQRVIIARALAQETPVLLLDEPTAHLDIGYQTGVLDTIDRVRKGMGLTVLAAMHDLTLAGQYCDRIAALHGGEVVALGEPAEVLTVPLVEKVFGSAVSIVEHPVHRTPAVLPVSRRYQERGQDK